ncbi:TPA: CHAP domain-containing protein [Streptococcus suis]
MTTKYQVASYARSLVGQKVTVPTNPYGGQCVALIDHILQHFTDGKLNMAYTNAKDCLDRAKAKGLEVIYYNGTNVPDVGDFFVCQWGPTDPFGHIGVCVTADRNMIVSVEQNIDGWRDDNGNGINDQLEIGGGGYTRHHSRNYDGVIGWFRLPYEEEKKVEEQDMFTISAPGRGIALVAGGTFYALLDAKDPVAFWDKGVPHMQISQATFDNFQHKSNLDRLDDETVNKLIKGLK